MAGLRKLTLLLPIGLGLLVMGTAALAFGSDARGLSPTRSTSAQLQLPVERAAQTTGISVLGDGEARAEPDMAVVSVGATHVAPTAQEATDEVNRRMGAVVAAARGHGLQDRDIQTSGISLQPITRPRPGPDQRPPDIEGYRATNTVILIVRDIGRASAVLDSATSAGANVVRGLRFALSNAAELRTRALGNAVRNAAQNAREIAQAAGVGLGEVIAIVEEGGVSITPRPAAEARSALAAEPAPVEPGELVVHARVRVTYAIG